MDQFCFSVDTSSPAGSIAIHRFHSNESAELLATTEWTRKKSHSDVITVLSQQTLKDAGLSVHDINYFACGCGPGSFTGIRVGLNLVRAFAYATNKPIFTINSLRVLAEPSLKNDGPPIYLMMNAFKNLIYFAAYQKKNDIVSEIHSPSALTLTQIETSICTPGLGLGSAIDLYKSDFSEKLNQTLTVDNHKSQYPQALDLGQICHKNLEKSNLFNWKEAKALYIRASEAEEKLKDGSLKPAPKL